VIYAHTHTHTHTYTHTQTHTQTHRHTHTHTHTTNDTQGIGIQFDGLIALGTNASQSINLKARGPSGQVVLQTNGSTRLIINGSTFHEFFGTGSSATQTYLFFGNNNATIRSQSTFFGDHTLYVYIYIIHI
jgi:hypothetical protein